ncbi:branched-subunit amino acid transport protein [Pseudochelatococcus lubricantis]|uniref:Branched-subunit amino acid transport protein n=1 Tax=Pseudochelatococcus lubricantis TaxID=1538102 RepID=A0ABX0UY75_9HYPH|nr:AzlD domain-containing protein [Pseudochelatococcus lubricantis]NIJ57904.1 branched-subunit amino acid transport protein [Pseudochelatococcus lubricantis]
MNGEILSTIAVCAALTLLVRALPIVFLSRMRMPAVLLDWLGFVPSAIMAALVTAEVVGRPAMTPSGISISLVATIVAAAAGAVSRSLFATIVAGVAAFLVLQALLM